jgi:type VI secretion system protein ImpC
MREGAVMPDETDLNPDQISGLIEHSLRRLGAPARRDAAGAVRAWIARIDALLSAQLAEVMHHPDFQRLEAAWRGLHYLVTRPEDCPDLRIRALSCAKQELYADLARAVEFDQSALFHKVYDETYGTPCGQPFGLLVGDFSFSADPDDVEFLKLLSGVAALSHAPFVAAASPRMFGCQRFIELAARRDLAAVFQGVEYGPWGAFRDSLDSNHVALTLPRVLARLPNGEGFRQPAGFNFEEFIGGRDPDKCLWMSAAWAYAANVADAFAKYGWFARTRGVEGGGKVSGLQVCDFSDEGDGTQKRVCEFAIDDRQEFHLSTLGFLPLLQSWNNDFAVFMGAQSCQRPRAYQDEDAYANAQLLARVDLLLCASRFVHCLKLLARDCYWAEGREECERRLNRWIKDYIVSGAHSQSESGLARAPLNDALVQARHVPGSIHEVVAWLRPEFQLEFSTASMRLLAAIPYPHPYRPAPVEPSWLRWKDDTIARMARAIRDSGRFADLPILADALEEAGCADERILGHCRDEWAGHAAGCWVLDALLA